jgi:hypothetical protein
MDLLTAIASVCISTLLVLNIAAYFRIKQRKKAMPA